ncbi:unnamed protein product [Scytosiphon promiscuus]
MGSEANAVRVGMVARALSLIAGLVVKSSALSVLPMEGNIQRVLSTSDLTSSTASDICPSEAAACSADSTCMSCGVSYNAALEACTASLTSFSSCDDFQAALCCAVGDCSGNAAFEDYVDCTIPSDDSSCGLSVGDCSSGTLDSGSDSGTTTDPTSESLSTTSNPTTSSETDCPTEVAACGADAECVTCAGSYSDAVDGCFASLTSASTCDDLEAAVCCAAEGCEDNVAFNALVACDVEEVNCGLIAVDECVADGSRAISGSDDLTTGTDSQTDVIPTSSSSTSGLTSDSDLTTTDTGSDIVPTPSPSSSLTSSTDVTSTTSDTDPCLVELDGCDEDATCSACLSLVAAAESACQGSDFNSDTATCSEILDNACCHIADDLDCANTALGAYFDCSAQEAGCDTSLADCLAESSGTSLVEDGGESETSLATDEEGGDDEDDGNAIFNPNPVTDDGDGEDAEDTDAANTNGCSATFSPGVGSGGVSIAAALLVAVSAATNVTWHLFK